MDGYRACGLRANNGHKSVARQGHPQFGIRRTPAHHPGIKDQKVGGCEDANDQKHNPPVVEFYKFGIHYLLPIWFQKTIRVYLNLINDTWLNQILLVWEYSSQASQSLIISCWNAGYIRAGPIRVVCS
jgi:hypothetical protein